MQYFVDLVHRQKTEATLEALDSAGLMTQRIIVTAGYWSDLPLTLYPAPTSSRDGTESYFNQIWRNMKSQCILKN